MKVVNLSGRPFVNRRPLVRLGVILWVLGGLLVLINLALFQSYLSDSRDVRGELADAEEQVAAELQELDVLDRQINSVSLTQQNSQAAYLNSLISYRTFPWSALFDDLERVMPLDMRLQSVTPAVKLAAAEALERAEEDARRQRLEQRRNRRSRRSSSATTNQVTSADDPALAQDEVQLQIRGVAKNEDALIEFLDTLYQDGSFRLPVLSGERFENIGGQLNSSFEISVIYLTGDRLSEGESSADTSSDADTDLASKDEEAEEGGGEGASPVEGEEIATAPADVTTPETATPQTQTQQATTLPSASAPVAPPPPRTEPRRSEPQRSESTQEPRRSSTRTERASGDASAPSASESAAEARRRRIEELRQRRREAIRRSRSGSSARSTTPAGQSTPRSNDGAADDGSSSRRTDRGGTSREPSNSDSDTPSASGTPRIRGSLMPGLPELLERFMPSSPSPFDEAWEELG